MTGCLKYPINILKGDNLKQIIKSPKNLVELIEKSVNEFSDSPLFGTKNKSGHYDWVTYAEVGERIDCLRSGLAKLGIKKDDSVGVIVDNSTEWAIAAFATYGLGARFIPMYEKELEKTWEYIIKDSNIKFLLVATKDIQKKILAKKNNLPDLENVYSIEGHDDTSMSSLETLGEKEIVPSIQPDPDDIAALIYTSGTTGNPKGVLLSHKNFCTNFYSAALLFPNVLKKGARSLSILPWAHSFGQTGDLYNFIGVVVVPLHNVRSVYNNFSFVTIWFKWHFINDNFDICNGFADTSKFNCSRAVCGDSRRRFR